VWMLSLGSGCPHTALSASIYIPMV
jgi:hypothetical protein